MPCCCCFVLFTQCLIKIIVVLCRMHTKRTSWVNTLRYHVKIFFFFYFFSLIHLSLWLLSTMHMCCHWSTNKSNYAMWNCCHVFSTAVAIFQVTWFFQIHLIGIIYFMKGGNSLTFQLIQLIRSNWVTEKNIISPVYSPVFGIVRLYRKSIQKEKKSH